MATDIVISLLRAGPSPADAPLLELRDQGEPVAKKKLPQADVEGRSAASRAARHGWHTVVIVFSATGTH
jgi:hypothetical protein